MLMRHAEDWSRPDRLARTMELMTPTRGTNTLFSKVGHQRRANREDHGDCGFYLGHMKFEVP